MAKKRKSPRQNLPDTFLGYDEPAGTIIRLHPEDSVRIRLANVFFRKELFKYFESLASGMTGWGVSFNSWLSFRGWQLIGMRTFQRVSGIEESIAAAEKSRGIRTRPTSQTRIRLGKNGKAEVWEGRRRVGAQG